MKFASNVVFVLLPMVANAFAPSHSVASSSPFTNTFGVVSSPQQPQQAQSTTTTTTTTTQLGLFNGVDGAQLTTYFLESLISTGIPTVATIAVIGFAANAFRSKDDENGRRSVNDLNNPTAQLYNDLYGDGSTKKGGFGGGSGGLPSFGPKPKGGTNPVNVGIPSQEFIKIEKLNTKLDSYKYSITAATQSKAVAAAEMREKKFDNALRMGASSSAGDSTGTGTHELTPYQKSQLLQVEKELLETGSQLVATIQSIQTSLTQDVIDKEMKLMDVTPSMLDPQPYNETAAMENGKNKKKENKDGGMMKRLSNILPSTNNKQTKDGEISTSGATWKELSNVQRDLTKLELEFIKDVIAIMGPERANGIRTALLGDMAVNGVPGGLVLKLKDRPLSAILNLVEQEDVEEETLSTTSGQPPKSLFVTQFPGDVSASQVSELRQEVTAIVRSAQPGDEALLVLQSGGGTVTGYGLAAAQLQRFKDHGMKLTICVEQVAASGGYMMCCVADRIVASPFAVLGSIGVISDIPNAYERLKKEGIEFQTITAGKYKRTVTPTKKITKDDLVKSQEDIEGILKLFKTFVHQNRPSLDIDDVATGETWFGTDALEKGLCDEIKTADDVLMDFVDQGFNVYDVKYELPKTPASGLSSLLPAGSEARTNGSGGGVLARGVRWVVRNVASEIKAELNDISVDQSSIEKKYMMMDNSSDNIRAQD